MATWNRANIIEYSIRSILDQTFEDWELLVIGDNCTDETEEVVSGIDDSRITFHNLPENFGEQSRPNNVGAGMARGELLAFLNHDDIWLPTHLEASINEMEREDADLVFSPALCLVPDEDHYISACTASRAFDAAVDIPVSTWVLKGELWNKVGPMRPARDLFSYPTAQWIRRASRRGARLINTERISVIHTQSGRWKDSYVNKKSSLTEDCYRILKRNGPEALLGRYLHPLALNAARISNGTGSAVRFGLWKGLRNGFYRLLSFLGISPVAFKHLLLYRKRGGFVNKLRRTRGLDSLPDGEKENKDGA